MKNFDQEREDRRPRRTEEERTFVLGGERFVARDRFRPEELTYMEDLPSKEVDNTTCTCGHRLHEHASIKGPCRATDCDCKKMTPVVTSPGPTLSQQIEALDNTILGMIEEEGHSRFHAVRDAKNDPVDVDDLMLVVQWLTETDAGRPTGAPGGSSPGRETTGAPSTVVSSSPDTPEA